MAEEKITRRRSGVLEQAIREAVGAELAEFGYAGVTFEGVARRAQTSKPVLYRRYRSRAHMVIDSWAAVAPLALPRRSSGSLRDDLIATMMAVVDRFDRVGIDTFRGIIADADDDLLDTVTAFTWSSSEEAIARILGNARERGELGDGEIPQRVLLLPIVLLRHELFFSRGQVGRASVEDIVDTVCLPLLISTSRAA